MTMPFPPIIIAAIYASAIQDQRIANQRLLQISVYLHEALVVNMQTHFHGAFRFIEKIYPANIRPSGYNCPDISLKVVRRQQASLLTGQAAVLQCKFRLRPNPNPGDHFLLQRNIRVFAPHPQPQIQLGSCHTFYERYNRLVGSALDGAATPAPPVFLRSGPKFAQDSAPLRRYVYVQKSQPIASTYPFYRRHCPSHTEL